jgi:hypothetical protein
MNGMSRRAQGVVDAVKRSRFADADRESVRAKLKAKIAAGALAGAGAGAAALPAKAAALTPGIVAKVGGAGLTWKLVVVGTVLGAVGLGVVARVGTTSEVRGPSDSAATVAAVAPVATPVVSFEVPPGASSSADSTRPAASALPAETQPAAQRPPVAPSPGKPATPRARSSASIAAELALLRRAQEALRAGDSDRSLAMIDELVAQHPTGALREERTAARVLALCAAGRTKEARALGQQFVARSPQSVQVARMKASCAFAPPTRP